MYRAVHYQPDSGDAIGEAGRGAVCAADGGNLCLLFGDPRRPAFCVGLRPSAEMCGASSVEAFVYLAELEVRTRP